MKIKSVAVYNWAKYNSISVNFAEHITYLIGKNGAGKSGLGLNAIWFIMQGIAEKSSGGNVPLLGERFRFIGPAAASAIGEMVLYDEKIRKEIRVIRKLTKSGSELSFSGPAGMKFDQQWLNELFNVFLIAPKRFLQLTSKEQSLTLGINTADFDQKISKLKTEYTELNAVYKAFGDIEAVEKVERIDLQKLQEEKAAISEKVNKQYLDNKESNKKLRDAWLLEKDLIKNEAAKFNELQAQRNVDYNQISHAVGVLVSFGFDNLELKAFIDKKYNEIEPQKTDLEFPPEPEYIEEMPDKTELATIDQQILDASEVNNKAQLYQQYLQRVADKDAKKIAMDSNKKEQDKIYEERLEYIKTFKFPFDKLSVDEDGGLLLNEKPLKEPYFSTGQLIRIVPMLMASLNPELKYIFLQDFNLLDQETQQSIEDDLTAQGFQLVIEYVGTEKVEDRNCILLKDNHVVGQTMLVQE